VLRYSGDMRELFSACRTARSEYDAYPRIVVEVGSRIEMCRWATDGKGLDVFLIRLY